MIVKLVMLYINIVKIKENNFTSGGKVYGKRFILYFAKYKNRY